MANGATHTVQPVLDSYTAAPVINGLKDRKAGVRK